MRLMEQNQEIVSQRKSRADCYPIVLFFIVVAGRTFFTARIFMSTLVTGADEIGTIASAAYFAGYQWTDVISDTLYYGFGYSMLVAPVFRLFENPAVIHQALLFVNNLLIGLCGVFAYKILTSYFGIRNRKSAVLIAAVMVLFFPLSFNGNLFMNETMLSLLVLLVLFLMLRLNRMEQGWRKNGSTILLGVVLCYSLLVHTRSLVLIAVTVLVIICMYFVTGRCMVNAFIFIPLLTAGAAFSQACVKAVQKGLWLVETGKSSDLANSTGYLTSSILDNLQKLFSYEGMKLYLMEILGQIYTMTVLTYGVNIIAVVGTALFLHSYSPKRIMAGVSIKGNDKRLQKDKYIYLTARNTSIMTAVLFSVMGVVITMAASSLAALDVVERQMGAGTASKWFLYSRYWSIYMLPVILLGGYFLYCCRGFAARLFFDCFFLMLGIAFLFSGYIGYRFCGQENKATGVFYPFLSIGFWNYNDTISSVSFFKITLLVTAVFFIFFLLVYQNKLNLAFAGLCALLAVNYVYGTCQVTLRISKTLSEQFAEVGKLVRDSGYNSEFIYTNGTYSPFKLWLQDLFPHQRVVYDIAESEGKEAIAVTDQVSEEFFDGEWSVVHEDHEGELLYEDLYVFARGMELTDRLAELGYMVRDPDLQELTGYYIMPFADEADEQEALGGILNGSVEQYFTVTDPMADSDFRIELFMATYMRQNQGILRLEIVQDAKVLSFDIDKSVIEDNAWFGVDVCGHGLRAGEAVVRITDPDNDSEQCVTVYTVDTDQLGDLYFQGMKSSRKLNMRVKKLIADTKEEELSGGAQ